MKKIFLFFLIFINLFVFSVRAKESEDDLGLAKNSESAIIMEQSTGKILFEKNAYEKRAMASMTKVMTMLLIMENLENGNIKLTDEVTISKRAAGMGGSQIFIEEGEIVSVEDLLKGIAVASANDASVALAEYIGGTEENFVKMMNDKAKKLGLKNTCYKNSHGLDEEGHYTTAYDMAIVSKELLNHKDILKYSSLYEDYLTRKNGSKFWLVNTNKLVKFYKGVDGLKTGYTGSAGHCLTATMEKNGMRVITVVMKSGSTENRSSDTVTLLDYAFSMFYSKVILNENEVLGKVNISKGVKNTVDYVLKVPVKAILGKHDDKMSYSYEINLKEDLEAPINIGDKVGNIVLYDENKKIVSEYDLYSNENVKKAGFFITYINNLKNITSGKILRKNIGV